MKSASPELIAFLNTSQQMTVVDLYTFSILKHRYEVEGSGLQNYYVDYRFNTWDQDVTVDGNTFSSAGALIDRDRVRSVLGVEVDTLLLRANASEDMTIDGWPFMQACARGTLDGARVRLDRAFLNGTSLIGTVNMFSGRVATLKTGRTQAEITVNSDLELLNVKIPRNLYQPSCQHTLYGSGCNAQRGGFAALGVVTDDGVTPTVGSFQVASANMANGYYDLGALIFVSGNQQGTMRTVKSWNNGVATLVNPLPFVPQAGDQVVLYPGCDKTQSTCASKFNNADNFRGFPFVPVPETMR